MRYGYRTLGYVAITLACYCCFSSPSFARVYISELLPDPSDEGDVGEWIELHNDGETGLLLIDYSLDDAEGGSRPYALSSVAIEAGGYAVIAKEASGIALNNSGDQVRLIYGEVVVDVVAYEAGIPEDFSYQWTGEIWEQTSVPTRGTAYMLPKPTPSAHPIVKATITISPDVVANDLELSEVMACPLTGEREWVELYNPSDQQVVADGWSLGDAGSTLHTLTGTVDAHDYLVVEYASHWMNNTGDTVRLIDPSGTERASFSYEACVKGFSYIAVDGVWQQTLVDTPGKPNAWEPFSTPSSVPHASDPTPTNSLSPPPTLALLAPSGELALDLDRSHTVASAAAQSTEPEGSVAGIVNMTDDAGLTSADRLSSSGVESSGAARGIRLYPPLYLFVGLFYAGYGYYLLTKSGSHAHI